MVFMGMSEFGKTDLIFVSPDAIISGIYYHDVLPTQQLLLFIWQISDNFFIFQQYSAPAH